MFQVWFWPINIINLNQTIDVCICWYWLSNMLQTHIWMNACSMRISSPIGLLKCSSSIFGRTHAMEHISPDAFVPDKSTFDLQYYSIKLDYNWMALWSKIKWSYRVYLGPKSHRSKWGWSCVSILLSWLGPIGRLSRATSMIAGASSFSRGDDDLISNG